MMLNQWIPLLFLNAGAATAGAARHVHKNAVNNFTSSCAGAASSLSIENATVYFSRFVAAGTNLSLPDRNATCALYVVTSNSSGINMEAGLPSNWTGRFLSVGNGGLAGCIGYSDLAYGASLGFASVGANNGHNGTSGGAFFNQPEVVADFAYRSIHTGVVVGKQITKSVYGSAHKKSYYLGCSTGGRQGFKSAQDFPRGEIVERNRRCSGHDAIKVLGSGSFASKIGHANSSTFVPPKLWAVVHQDIMKQCDTLDGYAVGILEDASISNYTALGLLCGSGANATACLTAAQVETVTKVFSPLYAADGSLVYPRMQPGSEIAASFAIYNGEVFQYTVDWFRYAIYNDANWDPNTLSTTDYADAARINPPNIETWKGDLSAVQNRGAKILHWHGQMDAIISSENSPRYYEHVSQTMSLSSSELDDFYRLFRGLASTQSWDPSENVLMAVVDWVENGAALETITCTRWINGTQALGLDYKRAHCKYPTRNQYKGEGNAKDPASWECV